MRALLIDPLKQVVEEIDYSGHWRDISLHLNCRCFDIVRLDQNNIVFVDDEGLINYQRLDVGGFYLPDYYPQPLAGRGLVLGNSPGGESVDTTLDTESLSDQVTWLGAFSPERRMTG